MNLLLGARLEHFEAALKALGKRMVIRLKTTSVARKMDTKIGPASFRLCAGPCSRPPNNRCADRFCEEDYSIRTDDRVALLYAFPLRSCSIAPYQSCSGDPSGQPRSCHSA